MRTCMSAIVLLSLLASPAVARNWTDKTGQKHAEAELVSVEDSVVRLRTPDGGLRSCKLNDLSAQDQAYVAELLSSQPIGPPNSLDQTTQAPADSNPSSGGYSQGVGTTGLAAFPVAAAMKTAMSQRARMAAAAPPASAQQLRGTYGPRLVYKGCDCHGCDFDFHLLPDDQGADVGSGEYWLGGTHFLDFLKQESAGPPFLIYKAFPAWPAERWAFSSAPWINGCYHVWRQPPGSPWVFHGYASRETLN
jgi:hypothetical protein